MKKESTIYKSKSHKQTLLELYDEKVESLKLDHEDIFVETTFGRTHILAVGDKCLPPIVVLHGINAGAGLAIEPIKNLAKKYRIYGVDTIGQAGKSDETKLSIKDESYGRWLAEVFDKLQLEKVPIIAASYGSFILGKLIAFEPNRIAKAIFIVPIVFANSYIFESIFKLLLPMQKFLITERNEDLIKFIEVFWGKPDDFAIRLQRNILLGVKMDTRRPSLIKVKDTKEFGAKVYILAADDDIFSPIDRLQKYAPKVFKNLSKIRVLANSKHVPSKSRYKEIEETVERWLED